MPKLVVGLLVFINENNYDRRIDMVKQSLRSMRTITSQDDVELLVINNGGGKIARDIIDENVVGNFTYVELDKNYFDVAVHICTLLRASQVGAKYVAYTYDDFIHYDNTWVEDSTKFMDLWKPVSCIRLPKYEYRDRSYYNKDITSTYTNPEAARHNNGAGTNNVVFSGPNQVGDHEFFISNWHPNSRPMMWRADRLVPALGNISGPIPVMQTFEHRLSHFANANHEMWLSGFLDRGICRTFPVNTSERTRDFQHYGHITVDPIEIRNAYIQGLRT